MRLQLDYDAMKATDQYQLALKLATDAHEGQTRKGLPDPYIVHPVRVADMAIRVGLDGDAVAAGLLHDTVEDCYDKGLCKDYLIEHGVSQRSVFLVSALTKWWPDTATAEVKRMSKPLYYGNIAGDRDATVLKLLDRADNLQDMLRMIRLHPSMRRWATNYARKTHAEFPILIAACPHLSVVDHFAKALAAVDLALQ